MKLIAYLRISEADPGQSETFSIAVQRASIAAYCKLYHHTIVAEYVDDGQSGKDMKRPGLKAALVQLGQPDVDGLISHKLDRVSGEHWLHVQHGQPCRFGQYGVPLRLAHHL